MLAGDLQTFLRFCRTAENPAAITDPCRGQAPFVPHRPDKAEKVHMV